MRGIQILGTSVVVPANEPDQLVSALIDCDINTGLWNVKFHSREPRLYLRSTELAVVFIK